MFCRYIGIYRILICIYIRANSEHFCEALPWHGGRPFSGLFGMLFGVIETLAQVEQQTLVHSRHRCVRVTPHRYVFNSA